MLRLLVQKKVQSCSPPSTRFGKAKSRSVSARMSVNGDSSARSLKANVPSTATFPSAAAWASRCFSHRSGAGNRVVVQHQRQRRAAVLEPQVACGSRTGVLLAQQAQREGGRPGLDLDGLRGAVVHEDHLEEGGVERLSAEPLQELHDQVGPVVGGDQYRQTRLDG